MKAQPKLKDYTDLGVEFADSPAGLLVKSVVESGVAWTAGLRSDDIVKKIGFEDVSAIAEMEKVIDELFKKRGKTSALMLLSGASGERWVDVSVAE